MLKDDIIIRAVLQPSPSKSFFNLRSVCCSCDDRVQIKTVGTSDDLVVDNCFLCVSDTSDIWNRHKLYTTKGRE